jgi:hypothetical protein
VHFPPWDDQRRPWDVHFLRWDVQRARWDNQGSPWDVQRPGWDVHFLRWDNQRAPWDIQRARWDVQRARWDVQWRCRDVRRPNLSEAAEGPLRQNGTQVDLYVGSVFVKSSDWLHSAFGSMLPPYPTTAHRIFSI